MLYAGLKKLKLDLHTHCGEALKTHHPTVEDTRKIIQAVREKGLDGLAITEHYDKEFGFRVKEIVESEFGNEIVVIPGWEISKSRQEIVELFLPDGAVFRFLAHPSYGARMVPGIRGIEFDNDLHNWHIAKDWVRKLAEENDLVMLSNSDAHSLDRIGSFHNEYNLEDLVRLAGNRTERRC